MHVVFAFMTLLVAMTGPLSAQAGRASAFVDVAVVPMDSARILEHQTVVVQDGHITALGPNDRVAVPATAARIDGRGKYLFPGLADMHTHISRYNPKSIDRALFLLLANGVTTIRDLEFLAKTDAVGLPEAGYGLQQVQIDGPDMLRLNAEILAGKRWGPRIYLSSAWHLDSTKSIAQNVAAYKEAGYHHIKIYDTYGYDTDSVGVDSLVQAAHQLGVPLVAHGYDPLSGGMARTLRLGLKSIEHLTPYVQFDPSRDPPDSLQVREWIAATVRDSIWNCPCPPDFGPSPLLGRGVPGSLERQYGIAEWRKSFGREPDSALVRFATALTPDTTGIGWWSRRYFSVIKALNDAGAGLLLGTDVPFWQVGFSIHRMLQGLVDAGLTPYEALRAGTRNVASYFGTLDSAGTVAVGKRADLVLVTGNPLEDIRHAGALAGVMAGGRWLSRNDMERRLDQFYGPMLRPLPSRPAPGRHRASELLGGTTGAQPGANR